MEGCCYSSLKFNFVINFVELETMPIFYVVDLFLDTNLNF